MRGGMVARDYLSQDRNYNSYKIGLNCNSTNIGVHRITVQGFKVMITITTLQSISVAVVVILAITSFTKSLNLTQLV